MFSDSNNPVFSSNQNMKIYESDQRAENSESNKKIKVSLKPMSFQPKPPSTPADKINPFKLHKFSNVKMK